MTQTRKILLILGHPDSNSLCGALHDIYLKGARSSGHEIKEIKLGEITFDPILHHGYKEIQPLEKDLLAAQEKIKWAEHLVIIFPTWWATFPALFKGFLDRVFLPGFGFKYHQNDPLWDKLLKGRSAHLIVTMGGPVIYYDFIARSPGVNAVKKGTLEFCGISPVKITKIGGAAKLEQDKFRAWSKKIEDAGRKGI